jgi:peptide/nickel transport system substrate-binding protein
MQAGRGLVRGAALIVVLATLVACTAQATERGELRVGSAQQPNTFDPDQLAYGGLSMYTNLLYDSLTGVDRSGTAVPELALSWEFSDDTRSVDFALREALTFPDGSPFNADVVVANIERSQTLETSRTRSFLVGVTAEAVSTYVVRLSNPQGATSLPLILSGPAGAMISKKAIDEGRDIGREPAGIGMFALESTASDFTQFAMVASENYWDSENVKLAGVRFTISGNSARYLQLRSGRSDLTYLPGDVDIPEGFVEETGINGNSSISINVNTSRDALRDARVRQAISMAIDRATICARILNGLCTPATQVYPVNSPYFDRGATSEFVTLDKEKAKALIDAAGFSGTSLTILTTTQDQTYSRIAEVVEQNLTEIGLKVRIKSFADATQMVLGFLGGDGDLMTGVIGPFADPAEVLGSFLLKDGFQNPGKFENPAVRQLGASALGERDSAKRTGFFRNISALTSQDLSVIPVVSENRRWILRQGVAGFTPVGVLGAFDLRGVSVSK